MNSHISRCPACGEAIDWCLGHGEIGDPVGWSILMDHDEGRHGMCSPAGCEQSPVLTLVRPEVQ